MGSPAAASASLNGQTVRVEHRGSSKTAATNNLLNVRMRRGPARRVLHPPAARVRGKHPANPPDHRRRNDATVRPAQGHASNPVRELERIGEAKGKPRAQPRALTIEERRHLLGWLDGTSNDPKVARPVSAAPLLLHRPR
jgi:hypothetical protein